MPHLDSPSASSSLLGAEPAPRLRPAPPALDLRRAALFLDFDGTLVDVAGTPDRVAVPPDLVAMLGRLAVELDGALAVVTGRRLADIDRLLDPLRLAGAGSHGAEMRRVAGGEVRFETAPLDPRLRLEIMALAALGDGVIVEAKHSAMAVHYRLAPGAEAAIEAALDAILAGRDSHWILRRGRRVFEIIPAEVSKGVALAILARLPQFAGRRPVMIGDDLADEGAFLAAGRLGGMGLRVAGEHFPSGAADFAGPAAVRRWLQAAAG